LYSEICVKALQQEISISTQINHPHIVKVWQVLSDPAKIYLIMEYVENGSLFYYQNQKKIFTEEESCIFFMQTLSAI
jgi:serine/threonine protein kinase